MSPDPLSTLSLPLEIWLLVTVVCTLLLWMDAILVVADGLRRRVSWRLHTSALLPLVVGLLAGLLANYIFGTMIYWTQQGVNAVQNGTAANGYVPQALANEIATAVGQVTLLGSVAVIATGIVLALGVSRLWSLRVVPVPARQ